MISIRPELTQDAAAVRRVHATAFPTVAEADLVERLRASGKAEISLVAEADGNIIGHVVFSRVTFEPQVDIIAYGLGPMAVVPGHEKHAVGRRLVQNGLAECHARDACMVAVLGDSVYYERFGFERASRHGLRNEFGVEESFMVFMLEAGAHPPPSTLVKYAPEFNALPRGARL
ncbi:MAG TPA: N-acetyltransferase [Burkholderiales bacterium]|nr:N-acetyltransferase [Burkholderiales bacterium]